MASNTLDHLETIVQQEVEDYARGGSWKTSIYAMSDTNRHQYTVLAVPDYPRKYRAGIIVMARIVDNLVFIEEDITDRPLIDELIRAGIPREKIICSYLGETPPQAESE